MTPTLGGRIQTRLFQVLAIGGVWTLFIGPFLPSRPSLGTTYWVTFQVLLWVAGLGLLWELLYHGLQQFRWEKDWPILFIFLQGINEGLLVWFLVGPLGLVAGVDRVPGSTFLAHFITTWVVTYLSIVGPIRVPFIDHRFEGGRLV